MDQPSLSEAMIRDGKGFMQRSFAHFSDRRAAYDAAEQGGACKRTRVLLEMNASANDPIRHHNLAQMVSRRFCDPHGVLHCYDKRTPKRGVFDSAPLRRRRL
jgi:hypothetical protein